MKKQAFACYFRRLAFEHGSLPPSILVSWSRQRQGWLPEGQAVSGPWVCYREEALLHVDRRPRRTTPHTGCSTLAEELGDYTHTHYFPNLKLRTISQPQSVARNQETKADVTRGKN